MVMVTYDETAAFYGGAYAFRGWVVVDPNLEPAEQRERIAALTELRTQQTGGAVVAGRDEMRIHV